MDLSAEQGANATLHGSLHLALTLAWQEAGRCVTETSCWCIIHIMVPCTHADEKAVCLLLLAEAAFSPGGQQGDMQRKQAAVPGCQGAWATGIWTTCLLLGLALAISNSNAPVTLYAESHTLLAGPKSHALHR